MSYPKWVSRGYGLGDILCLNEAEEDAVRNPPSTEEGAEDDAENEIETVESVRAKLDAAGIPYKKSLGLAKLKELLPQD